MQVGHLCLNPAGTKRGKMRYFDVVIPVSAGLKEIDGIIVELTEDVDLNNKFSITSLTTQGEEIALFPKLEI